MHNALSFPRIHNPKTAVCAVFCPSGLLIPAEAPEQQAGRIHKIQKKAAYGVGGDACVCVPAPRGQHFRTIGRADALNRMWLLPEEALYMLERGSLDIRWPDARNASAVVVNDASGGQSVVTGQQKAADGGVPMSLQAAYAMLLGRGGLSLARFSVYTGLKRNGYVIVRAPSWYGDVDADAVAEGDSVDASTDDEAASSSSRRIGAAVASICARITALAPLYPTCPARGPLIGLGTYRDYRSIYRALTLIPTHEPCARTSTTQTHNQLPPTTAPYRIAYHVYKPATPFRKSAPLPPDFRLAVIDVRDPSSQYASFVPPLTLLDPLLARCPPDPPRGERMQRLLYARLRHGQRSVILAVVDGGVVSFLRVSEAAFGGERLYEIQGPSGGRGKGGSQGKNKKR